MLECVQWIAAALAGTLVSSVLSCIPALHIYNVAALLLTVSLGAGSKIPDELFAMFMLGMVIGYAMLNTLPGIFLGAPDDSTLFMSLPSQQYLMRHKGYEAAVLSGVGGLAGVAILLVMAPMLFSIGRAVQRVVSPHLHWILAAIAIYMLMSEWPKGSGRGATALFRFWDAWRSLLAGLVTFGLSGAVGLVLFYGNLIPADRAFQNLTPAFVGLFAVPWVLQNILTQVQIPAQHVSHSLDLTPGSLLRGVGSGAVGGLFAAIFPAVTAGIGGLLAGQAIAQRDDRLFLVSQGTSKLVYYVGALLLFFVPGLNLTRGGMAWMLGIVYTPRSWQIYAVAVAATLLCGALAFFLLLGLSRLFIWLITWYDYRWISVVTLVLLGGVVLALTGWMGLFIAAISSAIGLLPLLWGTRRVNAMGVLLVPMILQASGWGVTLAAWMGLV